MAENTMKFKCNPPTLRNNYLKSQEYYGLGRVKG